MAEEMEKYGVDQDEDKTKTASEKKRCPKCGAVIRQHGKVCLCPKDGSEPFEGSEVVTVSSDKK
jgi:ribosomal protein S27AE